MAVRSKTIKSVKGGGGCALLIGQNNFTGSSITSLKNCGKQITGSFLKSHECGLSILSSFIKKMSI